MGLLDASDRFLHYNQPEPARRFQLRTKQDRENIARYAREIVLTTRCAYCPQSFHGRQEDGHNWMLEHRKECP